MLIYHNLYRYISNAKLRKQCSKYSFTIFGNYKRNKQNEKLNTQQIRLMHRELNKLKYEKLSKYYKYIKNIDELQLSQHDVKYLKDFTHTISCPEPITQLMHPLLLEKLVWPNKDENNDNNNNNNNNSNLYSAYKKLFEDNNNKILFGKYSPILFNVIYYVPSVSSLPCFVDLLNDIYMRTTTITQELKQITTHTYVKPTNNIINKLQNFIKSGQCYVATPKRLPPTWTKTKQQNYGETCNKTFIDFQTKSGML